MLLHRFAVQCVPDQKVNSSKKSSANAMSIMVSLYRRSVDATYQKMICQKIEEGVLDEYVTMMIVSLVNNGKFMTGAYSYHYGPVFQSTYILLIKVYQLPHARSQFNPS